MLKRIYIDNYNCFSEFEYRPERLQLILGTNGSGKTSLLEVLQALKEFVVGREAGSAFAYRSLRRGGETSHQRFEVDVQLEGSIYAYKLSIQWRGTPPEATVVSEELEKDGDSLLAPHAADATRTRFIQTPEALPFLEWLESLRCFQPNPFKRAGELQTQNGDKKPDIDLSNFLRWYSYLSECNRSADQRLQSSLREAIGGFDALEFRDVAKRFKYLHVKFSKGFTLGFDELSTGERCLIFLYTILHFVIEMGGTVVIDEPENFLALGEIQPWLMAAIDAAQDHHGQLLLISHSAELINLLAPRRGVLFLREGDGPVQVKKFSDVVDPDTTLPASELLARGWVGAER